jgi:hypothetical protein
VAVVCISTCNKEDSPSFLSILFIIIDLRLRKLHFYFGHKHS